VLNTIGQYSAPVSRRARVQRPELCPIKCARLRKGQEVETVGRGGWGAGSPHELQYL